MSTMKHLSRERRASSVERRAWDGPYGQGANIQLPTVEGELGNHQPSSSARHSTFQIRHSEGGFSLIEIMVTVTLLSFIILGLLAMFNQVQRAFRSSMTQVDVLEAGRAITDMLARDLEQIYPTQLPNQINGLWATNFLAVMNPQFNQPFLQTLPGTSDVNGPNQGPYRTNMIQTIFFTTKNNQDWIGTGYFVYPDSLTSFNAANAGSGVGTLYRFSTNRSKASAIQLGNDFLNAMTYVLNSTGTNLPPNVSRIADGVIDFRIRTYDTNGVSIVGMDYNGSKHLGFQTNYLHQSGVISNGYGYYALNEQMNYAYVSNAVPASMDLQIGFVEKHVLDRFRSIGGGSPVSGPAQQSQRDYLFKHPAEVHVFRQRIPVRNIDFSAYQ